MYKIICVVDNSARKGAGLKKEHGLSFWIETPQGNVLFDTGQTGGVLKHNMRKLGLQLANVDKLVLSHGHYDHTGGLAALLSAKPGIPLYAHSDVFRARFSKRRGVYKSIGMAMEHDHLATRTLLNLSDSAQEVFPDLWTTGEIKVRDELEGRSNAHFINRDGDMQADPYLDDLSMVLKTEQGLVLICGCCHAGLLNTIKHTQQNFGQNITTIIGGTHLAAADGDMMDEIIEKLKDLFSEQPNYYLNHCSGQDAVRIMQEAFGDRVSGFPAGSVLSFDPA